MEITDVAIDELLHIIDYPWFSYLFMELKNKKKKFLHEDGYERRQDIKYMHRHMQR